MSSLYGTSNRPTIHPGGAGKSDSAIAKHVGVDAQTVANWRGKLVVTSEIRKSITRTGSDGRTINTANIGRKPYSGGTGLALGMRDQVPGSPIGLCQRTSGACRGQGMRSLVFHAAFPCRNVAGFVRGVKGMSEYYHHHAD